MYNYYSANWFQVELKNGHIVSPDRVFVYRSNSSISNTVSEDNMPKFIYNLEYGTTNLTLKIGKKVIRMVENPFEKKEIPTVVNEFKGTQISFNMDTKDFEISSDFWETFDDSIKNSKDAPLSFESLNDFLNHVLASSNLYLYEAFMIDSFKLKKCMGHYHVAINLFKNIQALNKLEAIAKALGRDFLISNMAKENFNINAEAKKLKQTIEIPVDMAKKLKTLRIETSIDAIRAIVKTDGNFANLLLGFLSDYRKIFKENLNKGRYGISNYDPYTIVKLIENLVKLMQTGLHSSYKDLFNYLLSEAKNYGEIGIPSHEAKELLDYNDFIVGVMKDNPNVKMDVRPKNIEKAFKIARINNSINSNPRHEEFKAATDGYRYLDATIGDYLFVVPTREDELFTEGNELNHCVATYRDKIIDEGVKVVFMRKKNAPTVPFITIEYNSGVILQAKKKYHEDVDDPEILSVMSKWASSKLKMERK